MKAAPERPNVNYGYHGGKGFVVTMQSRTTWRTRIGDFIAWLEYRLDALLTRKR